MSEESIKQNDFFSNYQFENLRKLEKDFKYAIKSSLDKNTLDRFRNENGVELCGLHWQIVNDDIMTFEIGINDVDESLIENYGEYLNEARKGQMHLVSALFGSQGEPKYLHFKLVNEKISRNNIIDWSKFEISRDELKHFAENSDENNPIYVSCNINETLLNAKKHLETCNVCKQFWKYLWKFLAKNHILINDRTLIEEHAMDKRFYTETIKELNEKNIYYFTVEDGNLLSTFFVSFYVTMFKLANSSLEDFFGNHTHINILFSPLRFGALTKAVIVIATVKDNIPEIIFDFEKWLTNWAAHYEDFRQKHNLKIDIKDKILDLFYKEIQFILGNPKSDLEKKLSELLNTQNNAKQSIEKMDNKINYYKTQLQMPDGQKEIQRILNDIAKQRKE